jgi:putative colanic acid biosynthesis UDP-glucose lipid carrier transferase
LLLQILDLAIIMGTLWASSQYFYAWDTEYLIASLVGVAAFFLLALNSDLYAMGVKGGIARTSTQVFTLWLGVIFVFLASVFILKVSAIVSRAAVLSWFVATPLLLVTMRVLLARTAAVSWLWGSQRVTAAIYGSGPLARQFREAVEADPESGIVIEGCYDDPTNAPGLSACVDQSAPLGGADKLCLDARMRKYSLVILAPNEVQEGKLEQIVGDLADSNTDIYYVPDMTMFNMLDSRFRNIGGVPFIEVFYSPLDSMGRVFKRVEDILVGSLLLVLAALPMALIALAIKLDSPGRYGRGGETILVRKFRTMGVCEAGEQAVQATREDVRVTRVGKHLRRFSLDELPQLIDVIRGTMSVVGPRPHPIALNEEFRGAIKGYMLRHSVKPGITGWAQVNGWRGETETLEKMEQRVKHDLWYVRNWSLGLDLRIILATVFKVINDKSAY